MGSRSHTGTGFAQALRQVRTGKGLTQAVLAERAGLTASAIAKLEQGNREPSWATVLILASALRVSVADFVPVSQSPRLRRPKGQPLQTSGESLLRAILDAGGRDPYQWEILADWLGDTDSPTETHARRIAAHLRLRRPLRARPNFANNPRRASGRARLAQEWSAWDAASAAVRDRYGEEPPGALDEIVRACGVTADAARREMVSRLAAMRA